MAKSKDAARQQPRLYSSGDFAGAISAKTSEIERLEESRRQLLHAAFVDEDPASRDQVDSIASRIQQLERDVADFQFLRGEAEKREVAEERQRRQAAAEERRRLRMAALEEVLTATGTVDSAIAKLAAELEAYTGLVRAYLSEFDQDDPMLTAILRRAIPRDAQFRDERMSGSSFLTSAAWHAHLNHYFELRFVRHTERLPLRESLPAYIESRRPGPEQNTALVTERL